MNTEHMLAEIRDANLGFLMLAQKLIAQDKAEAVDCLGITGASADLLAGLSNAQVMKLASGNTLLQRFRMDDDMVFGLITSHRTPASAGGIGGLLAGRTLAAA